MATAKQILVRLILYSLSACLSLVIVTCLLVLRLIKGEKYFETKPRPTPPAILNDPKWGTHKYLNLKSQGIRMHYVEAGDSQKPLIVCLHGFPECWFSWRHQLEHLSKDYWVVAVDLRGYGDTDKPPKTSDYAIDTLIEDVRQFILALGKDKCTLMAHDWGGALAWRLVIQYPELFNYHVSCNGPHPNAFNKQLNTSWKQKFMSWYMIFFQSPWVPELLLRVNDLQCFQDMFRGKQNNTNAFPDEVMEAYKYHFSQKDAFTPPLNYYRNIDFTALGVTYPKVTVPTLIVWGVDDVALSKDLAIKAVDECENAELKFIEEATHWVQQDQPELVNGYIKEFISAKE